MIQDSPIARFIGHGSAAMISIGDSPHDSEENKLAHHHLIYMGVLMSYGGIVWGAIAVLYGLILASAAPLSYVVLTALNFAYFSISKNFVRVRRFQVLISLLLPFIFQWSLGGFVASGAVLEGKDVGGPGLTGAAVQLSRSGAHVRFSFPVDVLTNLKLNLDDVDEALSAKDFYAKVMRCLGDQGEVYFVSLTSVPAEIDAYFQAHLVFGSRSATMAPAT